MLRVAATVRVTIDRIQVPWRIAEQRREKRAVAVTALTPLMSPLPTFASPILEC
jgi:hypothetical protein